MGQISSAASTALRDHNVDGVPASGAHEVVKSQLRDTFGVVDAQVSALQTQITAMQQSGVLVFATKAALDASLGYPANTGAEVWADPTTANNGIYRKTGASGAGGWVYVSSLGVNGLAARIAVLEQAVTTNGLEDLARAIGDPWRSLWVVLVGDSITWGVGATGNAPATTQNGTLADSRDYVTTPSWANKLRRFLARLVCDELNPDSAGPGSQQFTKPRDLDICNDPRVSVVNVATGAAVAKVITNPATGPVLNRYLDVAPGQALEFTYVGDRFDVVFSSQSGAADAGFEVLVDGISIGVYSTYNAGGAQWSRVQAVVPAFASHVVRVRNTHGSVGLRLEAIRHHRKLRLDNQGLIGTVTQQWVSANLTTGVATNATHCLIMLGTNDRVKNGVGPSPLPDNPVRLREGMLAVLDLLASSKPGVRPILMIANKALGTKEIFGNPADYAFGMADVQTVLRRIAAERNLPIIDHYGMTHMMDLKGQSFTADDLHPNDAGHQAMFETIVDAILERME